MALQDIANWLSKNNLQRKCFTRQKRLLPLLSLLLFYTGKAQIANYINNGSFEETYGCTWQNDISKAKYWLSIDSTSYAGAYMSACPNYALVPLNGFTFQYPKSGIAYAIGTQYLPDYPNGDRDYLKNRMKSTLKAGESYCVKFYVNISNNSTYGMDGFGLYFGNSSIDTITKCNFALPYLHPQVKNTPHNIIIDTLNWTLITGTFVANGDEKYALFGNFEADNNVDTALIDTTNLPLIGTDVCVDDISCIPLDLPAFAGYDTTCIAGTSVYIGRPQDVGIDEACKWYKLPIVITPTTPALDTAAGIWVSPTQTSTYVVVQEICGGIKMDTVIVRQDWVGLQERFLNSELTIFPNPASNQLNFNFDGSFDPGKLRVQISNELGQLVYQEYLPFANQQAQLNVSDLANGAYNLTLSNSGGAARHIKLIIAN